ncbi:hypothetical protein M3Y97_00205300 [Aphelenchoides bicaudatus]|nr:hypothetical protein M3Y97_00205300 [Aphelenchoides bicaudatus]
MSRLGSLFLIALFASFAVICFGNDIEDKNEDRCTAERCQNGGRCIQVTETRATCQCGFGFIGDFCEEHFVPAFNFLQHDPEYMHEHPKNVWGRRYETEAIRPVFTESARTLTDVLQRLYNNLVHFNNIGVKKQGERPNFGFAAK